MAIPAIAAGAIAAGQMMGTMAASAQSQQMNERQQIRQLAWEREKLGLEQAYNTQMANSAHQREVADLKAAGLNPILSAGGQGAASIPAQGGSIGALPDQSGQIMANGLNSAIANMIQKQQVDAQVNLMEKQGLEASANAIKYLSESGALDAKAKESAASAFMHEQKTENLRKEAQILQTQIDNKQLLKQQLIEEINMLKENVKTAKTEREKSKAQTELTRAETGLTNVKKDLYKLGHIAAIVASAATGIGGTLGVVANTGKIVQMFKGATKVAGFMK